LKKFARNVLVLLGCFLVVVVCCIGLTDWRRLVYELDQKTFTKIADFLYPENTPEENLPVLNLEFDGKQLDGAFAALQELDFKSYRKQNTWIPAQVTWKDTLQDCEVRFHGKTPNYHLVGNRHSLSLRCPSAVKGLRKLRLIVYERLWNNPVYIEGLALLFGLYYQRNTLIQVRLNTGNENGSHLFYFEDPLKDEFLAQHGLIHLGLSDRKSAVIQSIDDTSKFSSQLLTEMAKSSKENKPYWTKYKQLNEAVAHPDNSDLSEFFDLGYLSHFVNALKLGGIDGHGFTKENFYLALDSSKMLFYPVLHRDCFVGKYETGLLPIYRPFFHPDGQQQHSPILAWILGDSSLNQLCIAQWKKDRQQIQTHLRKLAAKPELELMGRSPRFGFISEAPFTKVDLPGNFSKLDAYYEKTP